MNLIGALTFSREKQSKGFKSDGCTFAPELGIKKFCQMHDALRAFAPVTPREADALLFEGIKSKGKLYLPVAALYWLAVRFQHIVGGTAPAIGILFLGAFITAALVLS